MKPVFHLLVVAAIFFAQTMAQDDDDDDGPPSPYGGAQPYSGYPAMGAFPPGDSDGSPYLNVDPYREVGAVEEGPLIDPYLQNFRG